MRLAGTIALLVVGALAGCTPTESGRTTTTRRSANSGGALRQAHLFTSNSGWVLTADRLLTTSDGGTSWADVTPPRGTNTSIETAFFLNPSVGWAVRLRRENIGGYAAPLDLLTTSDGGRHWNSLGMAATTPIDTPGPVYLTFVDPIRGWLVVDQGSHAGFMYYQGFRTTNGGRTWKKLAYPQSAPVHFLNQMDGFSVGGGDGPKAGAYGTHDGGQTWARLGLPQAGGSAWSSRMDLPVFSDDRTGVLAGEVFDQSGSGASVVFYTTSDAGRTWRLAATIANPHPGNSVQAGGVVTEKVWLAAFYEAGPVQHTTYTLLKATHDGGRTWESMPAPLSGYLTNQINFAGSTGWAIMADSGCRGFKTDCFTNYGLFQTKDFGSNWVHVPLP